MRKFWNLEQMTAAGLPPWQRDAVAEAVLTLEGIFGRGFSVCRGFVLLVEQHDQFGAVDALLGSRLADKLEGTWRCHGCLVSLVLWGNSGDGVTLVCPELPDYAVELQKIMRRAL